MHTNRLKKNKKRIYLRTKNLHFSDSYDDSFTTLMYAYALCIPTVFEL